MKSSQQNRTDHAVADCKAFIILLRHVAVSGSKLSSQVGQ
uniref:DegP7 n=1 Tax=Arundo donax TaxID=35708 RepID=A0A0A9F8Z3_ARUDO